MYHGSMYTSKLCVSLKHGCPCHAQSIIRAQGLNQGSALLILIPQLHITFLDVWSEWEQQLMQWTSSYGTLHIISGCLLDSDGDGMRDDDGDYDQ